MQTIKIQCMKKQALSLEQIATLCGVSLCRVKRWIEKKGLQTRSHEGAEEIVLHADLIDFLVKFNMPIPDSIMPFQAKKILFIYSNFSDERLFIRFLVHFLGQLKKEQHNLIADHVSYGPDAKMKVMVFKPDLIILDMMENDQEAVAMSRQIKDTEEFSSIRLVAITGAALPERERDAFRRNGIDEVVSSSVEIKQLAKQMRDFA
jgi:CheY-like chemotaxis protein